MSTKLSQDVSIGENLRILRKRAGYSQERAAAQLELMGISMSREIISQMESGHHNIRISVLLAFKQVYEVDSFDDFFVQQEKGGVRFGHGFSLSLHIIRYFGVGPSPDLS